ncbi:ABC transporter substrate-binding protein [Desulfobacula phenolica]|uniref:Oligopeptide transport system substrate-binding protein n=1 Tax=Desulfobacula phenolica TaxID=90732 RepID=A0A1H2HSV1_9BACT|nr:ABC transporter substrate-binding protein [Desulfobacula phenolica]SDU34980.1 oligopeptide transport system substrate-binding protein [Desulfobacula phenolica]
MNMSGLFSIFCVPFFFLNLIFLPGCTNQDKKEQTQSALSSSVPIQGGIYRASLRSNPPTLDPALVQDNYGETIVHQIFDGLVRYDSYLSVLPALAETWQVKEDGKVYQFKLKKTARFHNLDPVTSQDVIFSFKRLLRAEHPSAVLPHLLKIVGAKEYRAGTLENIPGLKIENEQIFTVHLRESHVPFLTALGMYQASIVSQKEVILLKEDFGKNPVGSGPFSFISWEEGKSIQLKRFEEYYAEPAFLDEIHYKIYPGGQDPIIFADFQNNNLEEMEVYGDVKKKLSENKELQWFHRPSLSLFFYGMNLKHPNLANPDLRKALSIAVDRKALVNQVYKGQFDIATNILPLGMPGRTPLSQMEDNNPDLARQHLKQAFSTTLDKQPELEIVSAIQTPRVEQEITIIKNAWSKLGIKIRAKYITDWEEFETYLNSDAVQIYRYVWFADMPDPDSFLYSLFASESPTNFMNLEDKNIDRMLLAARAIVDPVERAGMYQKTEAAIMESAPLIPLFYMSVDRVYQPYVKSVNVSALGAHNLQLNKIWLDKHHQND